MPMLRSYLSALSKLRTAEARSEARWRIRRAVQIPAFVSHRSEFTNVYHCCVYRTGSQWLRGLLSDRRVYRGSGLRTLTYQERLRGRIDPRPVTERTFVGPFPEHRIVTPLYLSLDNFRAMPKPDAYRAFFVYRNPRDVLLSTYFLRRNTDTLGNDPEDQAYLRSASVDDGLISVIDRSDRTGVFEAFRSWHAADATDPNVRLVRYEDLTGDAGLGEMEKLFSFCDIAVEPAETAELMAKFSFARLSGGRRKGQSDAASHYRSGVSGQGREYFTPRVEERFQEAAGDLLTLFRYE
jgi:Sulfotransferase domain